MKDKRIKLSTITNALSLVKERTKLTQDLRTLQTSITTEKVRVYSAGMYNKTCIGSLDKKYIVQAIEAEIVDIDYRLATLGVEVDCV